MYVNTKILTMVTLLDTAPMGVHDPTPLSIGTYQTMYAHSHKGGHYIGDCTPTCDWGQSHVKRSRRNFEAGQAVKVGIRGSLETVKGSPGNRWAWLMLDSQESRPDFGAIKGSVRILTVVAVPQHLMTKLYTLAHQGMP